MTVPSVHSAVDTQLLEAVSAVAEDIALILRTDADADARIPGAVWSVDEAAAHLAMANELMADIAQGRERRYGDGTAASLAAANAESLAAYGERDLGVLAGVIVRQAGAFVEAAGLRSAAEPVLTPLGPMDLGTLGSYLLTHMLGHGYDLARALNRPHMINRERVELAVPFLALAMPRVVDARAAAGLRARYVVGLRGGSRIGVAFADGTVTVSQELPRRADCTIVTEPTAFLLMALGRGGPWSALARGRVLAWGRRPWLAPRFPGYFTAP